MELSFDIDQCREKINMMKSIAFTLWAVLEAEDSIYTGAVQVLYDGLREQTVELERLSNITEKPMEHSSSN